MTRRQVLIGGSAVSVAAVGVGVAEGSLHRYHASTALPTGASVTGMAIPSFVLDAHTDDELAELLRTVRQLRCRWVRFDVFWESVEKAKGQFDWTSTDRLVLAATSAGLQVLPVVHTTPEWVRPAGASHVFGPADDTARAAYANFCATAARRYRDTVRCWEIWNEPNVTAFWAPAPSPEAYQLLLSAAHAAIKSVDESLLVMSGGPGGPTRPHELDPLQFLKAVLDAGGGDCLDVVALHPYTNMDGSVSGGLVQTPQVVAELGRRQLGHIPVWGTETGAPTKGNDGVVVSEAEQARVLGMTFKYWSALEGVGPLFWFTLLDTGTTSRYETFGLVDTSGRRKQAFEAMRQPPG